MGWCFFIPPPQDLITLREIAHAGRQKNRDTLQSNSVLYTCITLISRK